MAIKKVKVSQLPKATTTSGLKVLGVDGSNQSVQAEMEILRGNKGDSAFDLWKMQPGNTDKTYDDYLAFNRQPAEEAASEMNIYKNQVTDELTQLAGDMEQARIAADTAADKASDIASNPTKVGEDYFVYIYNNKTKEYEKTDINLKGDSAFTLWVNDPVNEGKTYDDYLAYNRQPATEAAEALGSYQTQVTGELNQLAKSTESAKTAAQQAASLANEVAANPTKVGEDNYVYVYNQETKAYEKTDIYVKGDKGDKGNTLYASFEIDLASGQLIQTTPDEYSGPTFELNQSGELIAIING